jgi:hypothetical protein
LTSEPKSLVDTNLSLVTFLLYKSRLIIGDSLNTVTLPVNECEAPCPLGPLTAQQPSPVGRAESAQLPDRRSLGIISEVLSLFLAFPIIWGKKGSSPFPEVGENPGAERLSPCPRLQPCGYNLSRVQILC